MAAFNICQASPVAPAAPLETGARSLLIEDVTVVPMTPGDSETRDAAVLVRQGQIAAVLPDAMAKGFHGVRRIEGHGKWLMPALTDSHVHLENDRLLRLYLKTPELRAGTVRTEDMLLPYVANGVLQVVDLSAMSETFAQRADVDAGRALGPHIVAAAMIDGAPPTWPVGMTRVATSPEGGRQAVRDAAVEGYDLIKVYSNLDLATFTAIVDEARQLHMRVVGHIPGRRQGITEKFFQPGYDMVAHAEEFAQQTTEPEEGAIPQYVDMAKRNGTWLTATLTLDERLLEEMRDPLTLRVRPELEYLHPLLHKVARDHNPYLVGATAERIRDFERIVAFNGKLVAAFANAGIPVLAGTDTPVPGLAPGFSLHDELEALVRAGLTPRQALDGATRWPCEWLGEAGACGVVVRGARADLLLLDADPLADVRNTRRIAAVISGGRYLSRAELDCRMAELRARFAATN